MIEIRQSSTSPLLFLLVDAADLKTPATGLSPTVVISKAGGSFAAPSGSVSEVGHGIYRLDASAADTGTIGALALHATAAGAHGSPMLYEVVSHTRAEVMAAIAGLASAPTTAQIRAELAAELARIDVAISSRNAAPPPDAATIQAATAAALAAYDAPTRTEASADVAAVIAAFPSVAEIIGAAGALAPETVAALEAAEQILLTAPYVAAETPARIIPAPATDEALTVVYAHTENIVSEVRAGIVMSFRLAEVPAATERLLEVAAHTATTDATGYAAITLVSGMLYRVTCRELGLDRTFTPTGPTFNLLSTVVP